MDDLFRDAADRAARYLDEAKERRVTPDDDAVAALDRLAGDLPENPTDARQVLALLDEVASPATVTSAGPRFFGFVIGGSLPAALAANYLAGAWDQNAGLHVASPAAAKLEEIAGAWLLGLLDLPRSCAFGFVTGATSANFTAVCAARRLLLERAGWDADRNGLFGAPPIRVVVGEGVHASLLKGLSLAGLGRDRVERVPMDDQGRMIADKLPDLDDRTLLCVQAGHVDSGAFDPIDEVCARAESAGSWVHVDGAFGLWARASKTFRELAVGIDGADSWALDAHKWLNVPYDSGLVFCRHEAAMRGALSMSSAPYLIEGAPREPYHYTPELSRKGRGPEVWAALRSLGRSGVEGLIDRCCAHARLFRDLLTAAGFEILNDVVLNQVLVAFGADERTDRVIEEVRREGTCWVGGTTWRGRRAMRISVSNWSTTREDVERSVDAMTRVASGIQ